jgi:DNA repair protein RecN (Recombination protein N)
MIVEISVSQLAIIDQTTLSLGRGLTVLTGETGAGKSLLIDAIQLALGERADADQVRDHAASATVAVAFDLTGRPEIIDLCRELGVSTDDAMLFVQREVFAEGRSQCRLGGRLTPATVLRQLGDSLVDLHGQHDHQSLLHTERHLEYLDLWIGAEASHLRKETKAAYTSYVEAKRKLDAVRADIQNRDRKLDLLRFQIEEIQSVGPQIGEYLELQTNLTRLQHLEKLVTAAEGARQNLSEAEGSALELTGNALKSLEEAQKYDPLVSAMAGQLREVVFQLEDLSSSLGKFLDGLDATPDAAEELSNRLESLKRLRRKYGEDEEKILRSLEDARLQLEALEDVEASEEALDAKVQTSLDLFLKHANTLSELRKKRSKEFSIEIEAQLQDLALENSRFAVGLKPADPSARGVDDIEFVFSANPGEPLRPLERVASGGEVSRLMLAMKTVLAGKAGVPTLIFDEVDNGLGGRVGAIVGRKLVELSRLYQVVVISHLPQVAALADQHFKIEKAEVDSRTSTRVRKLDPPERVEEIARMLAGEELSDTALAHARQLLGVA